jgi:pentatricopeptide repeat protein
LVGVLSRSADAKSLRFAEEVLQWCRSQHRMTVPVYSAMMKVYAYCGLHARACDLYPEICEQGLVPDSIMYGCLMLTSLYIH